MKMNPEAVNHKKDLQEAAGRLHKVACVAGAQGATLLKQAPWGKMAKVSRVSFAFLIMCVTMLFHLACAVVVALGELNEDDEEADSTGGSWIDEDGDHDGSRIFTKLGMDLNSSIR